MHGDQRYVEQKGKSWVARMKAITLNHDLLRVGVTIPPPTVPRLATDFLPDLTDPHAQSPQAGPKLPQQRRLPQDDMFHLQQEEQLSSSRSSILNFGILAMEKLNFVLKCDLNSPIIFEVILRNKIRKNSYLNAKFCVICRLQFLGLSTNDTFWELGSQSLLMPKLFAAENNTLNQCRDTNSK